MTPRHWQHCNALAGVIAMRANASASLQCMPMPQGHYIVPIPYDSDESRRIAMHSNAVGDVLAMHPKASAGIAMLMPRPNAAKALQ